MFCSYFSDTRYGWVAFCENLFQPHETAPAPRIIAPSTPNSGDEIRNQEPRPTSRQRSSNLRSTDDAVHEQNPVTTERSSPTRVKLAPYEHAPVPAVAVAQRDW